LTITSDKKHNAESPRRNKTESLIEIFYKPQFYVIEYNCEEII